MEVHSTAFTEGAMIPVKYSCLGADVSPPLSWKDLPANTRTIALICDDPDAPAGTWVHWVYYDIPPDLSGLTENVPPEDRPAVGGCQGVNDFRKTGYGGPCPPGGTHRYFFKVFALDAKLELPPGATKAQLLAAMDGRILAQAQLMGKFRR